MDLIFIPMLWLLFAVFSALIATSKSRSGLGWFLIGLLFGPFGILVAALPAAEPIIDQPGNFSNQYGNVGATAGTNRKCPFCAEVIKAEAIVCRFCGRDLPVFQATDAGLLQAALNGDVGGVKTSLDRGADINARNNYGATPLFLAAVQNRLQLAQLLLERGADPTIRNNAGKTPREAAAEQGYSEIVALL